LREYLDLERLPPLNSKSGGVVFNNLSVFRSALVATLLFATAFFAAFSATAACCFAALSAASYDSIVAGAGVFAADAGALSAAPDDDVAACGAACGAGLDGAFLTGCCGINAGACGACGAADAAAAGALSAAPDDDVAVGACTGAPDSNVADSGSVDLVGAGLDGGADDGGAGLTAAPDSDADAGGFVLLS